MQEPIVAALHETPGGGGHGLHLSPKCGKLQRGAYMKKCLEKGSVGQSFDDFLKEQGRFEESTNQAVKRVIAYQLAAAMEKQHMTKSALARKLQYESFATRPAARPRKHQCHAGCTDPRCPGCRAAAAIGVAVGMSLPGYNREADRCNSLSVFAVRFSQELPRTNAQMRSSWSKRSIRIRILATRRKTTRLGLEPRMREPKSLVLPLHHRVRKT